MTHRRPILLLLTALVAVALPVLVGVPRAAAVRSNGVDNDPSNKLWDCPARHVPFGSDAQDALRCITHRFSVPAGGITSAYLRLAIKPQGLQDTDGLFIAVGREFAECKGLQGSMAGCVTLHSNIRGTSQALTVNLRDIACNKGLPRPPEPGEQDAVNAQLATGVIHVLLQDDTAVLSSELVLNEGDPSECGQSDAPAKLPGGTGDVDIRTEKTTYAQGEGIKVLWTNLPAAKPGTRHWVAISPAGSADDRYGPWTWADASSGSWDAGTLSPGRYEARAYLNWSTDGHAVRGRFAFTVGDAPPSTSPPPPCARATGSNTPAPAFDAPEPAVVGCMTLQVGRKRAREGERFAIQIYAMNATNVANINYRIDYDPNVIKAEQGVRRAEFMGSALQQANTEISGRVLVGMAQTDGYSTSASRPAQIINYVFFTARGKPGDKTPLRIQVTTINDATGNRLTIDTIEGVVEIVGPDGGVVGDCDGDGVMRENDAQCALQVSVQLFEPSAGQRTALDLDRNGEITSRDAALILQRAIGKV